MADKKFDPAEHLIDLKGKQYLEVKWRLVWLRTEHPDAVIVTNLEKLQNDFAIFSANVTLPSGARGSGWGSETAQDFGDFIEKAETKALGRALASLGFGTQFTDDAEVLERPADSPVQRRQVEQPRLDRPARPPQQGAGLGTCPVHNLPWLISKQPNGSPYHAVPAPGKGWCSKWDVEKALLQRNQVPTSDDEALEKMFREKGF